MGEQTIERREALQIKKLVHKSFDGPITTEEVLLIEQALSEYPAMRSWYVDVSQLHADLTSAKQSRDLCKQVQFEFREGCGTPPPKAPSTPVRAATRRFRSMTARFPIGIAASLLIIGLGFGCGVGLLAASIHYVVPEFVISPWTWEVSDDVVAKIESTHNVTWQPSQAPDTLPTQGLRTGQQIRLEEGMIQLQYRSGTSVILMGPAVYEVRGQTGGKLYAGRLSAVSTADAPIFTVDTSTGRFQFGAGHYGVEEMAFASRNGVAMPGVTVHVFAGMAPGVYSGLFTTSDGATTDLIAGDSLVFEYGELPTRVSTPSSNRFPAYMPIVEPDVFDGDTIHLGNLFDDSKSASLIEAMATDTYHAACETVDLGIAAVYDGGLDVDLPLAEDGVYFNFSNAGGGGPKVLGLPANDAYRSTHPVPIRTTGQDFPTSFRQDQKIEEGIGLCTNELITFDLDELRNAGGLGSKTLRFVVDKAGINDFEEEHLKSRSMASANIIVVLSSTDEVLATQINGVPREVVNRDGVYSIDHSKDKMPDHLRYNGKFASFDIEVPPHARFLTIASAMIWDEHFDHVVLSGARLEIMDAPSAEVGQVTR